MDVPGAPPAGARRVDRGDVGDAGLARRLAAPAAGVEDGHPCPRSTRPSTRRRRAGGRDPPAFAKVQVTGTLRPGPAALYGAERPRRARRRSRSWARNWWCPWNGRARRRCWCIAAGSTPQARPRHPRRPGDGRGLGASTRKSSRTGSARATTRATRRFYTLTRPRSARRWACRRSPLTFWWRSARPASPTPPARCRDRRTTISVTR